MTGNFIKTLASLILILNTWPLTATDDKQEPKEPAAVHTQRVTPTELFEPKTFAGFVRPLAEKQIFSPLEGTIVSSNVNQGELVEKNQVLFTMKPGRDGLDYALRKVRAPSKGYLIGMPPVSGQRVTTSEKLFSIIWPKDFRITGQATFDDISSLEEGSEVTVVLSNGKNGSLKLPGKVRAISFHADLATGTSPIEIEFTCPDDWTPVSCLKNTRPGSIAKFEFRMNKRMGFKISLKHLHKNQSKVFLVGKDGTVEWRDVKLGQNYGDSMEVIEGIRANDQLITHYSSQPRNGEKVVIEKAETAAPIIQKTKKDDKS